MNRLCAITSSILLMLLVLNSCGHKEILCPGNDPHVVTVKFMWDKAPEADPEGMTLYFFPSSDGTRIWRFDITGREGGNVEIPPGTYRFLAVNNDLPGVVFSNPDTFGNFTANARKTSGTTTLTPTGMLYGASIDHMEVTPCGITYTTPDGAIKNCRQGIMRCYPDSLSSIYHVVFTNCKGLENMRSATAILHGIAPSIIISSGIPEGEPSENTIKLAHIDRPNGNTLTGSTTAFGIPANHTPCVTLILKVERTDGKIIQKKIDVTDQVVNSPDTHNVFIIINDIEIPEGEIPDNPEGDVGIEVGVEEWQVIEIDISTNLP